MTVNLITRRSQVQILPPPPCDVARHPGRSEPSTGFGSFDGPPAGLPVPWYLWSGLMVSARMISPVAA